MVDDKVAAIGFTLPSTTTSINPTSNNLPTSPTISVSTIQSTSPSTTSSLRDENASFSSKISNSPSDTSSVPNPPSETASSSRSNQTAPYTTSPSARTNTVDSNRKLGIGEIVGIVIGTLAVIVAIIGVCIAYWQYRLHAGRQIQQRSRNEPLSIGMNDLASPHGKYA